MPLRPSIVIPTKDRHITLERLLESILNQKLKPNEAIIVDDKSRTLETYSIYLKYLKKFNKIGIKLIYIRNERGKGSSAARNIGISYCKSEIIFFIDDDIYLDKIFVQKMTNYLNLNDKLLAVTGRVVNFRKSGIIYLFIANIFFLTHSIKNKNKILPFGIITARSDSDKNFICGYIDSGVCAIKRKVFSNLGFKFDENLKNYSYREETILSYQLNLRFPNSMMFVHEAKALHFRHSSLNIKKIKTIILNQYYFYFKYFNRSLMSDFIFFWSNLGFILFRAIYFIYSPVKENFNILNKSILYTIQAIKILYVIKKEQERNYNKFLYI